MKKFIETLGVVMCLLAILGMIVSIHLNAQAQTWCPAPHLTKSILDGKEFYEIPDVPSINGPDLEAAYRHDGSVESRHYYAIKELAFRVWCLEQKTGFKQPQADR